MTLRAVLDWANQDSTQDLNSRFQALFKRGVLTGGEISPVSGQLQIVLQPFTAISYDGMLVSDTDAILLNIPLDQTSIIAIYAKHQIGEAALLEISVVESSLFYSLVDREYYVVFGAVTAITPQTEIDDSDISYDLRETQDQRTRDKIRGIVYDLVDLPSDPRFIVYGDSYVVYSGVGVAPNIYSWDGLIWVNITGASVVGVALDRHQHNLDTDLYTGESVSEIGRLHLSNYQKDAAIGSYGTPSSVNKYVTENDPRIPTTDQSAALQGSDGSPSSTNKYVTQEYPIAVPTIATGIGGVYYDISSLCPVFVGNGGVDTPNVYFSLMDGVLNRGYVTPDVLPATIEGVYKQISPTLIKLNPSVDTALVDSNGFFIGTTLYLGFSVPVVPSGSSLALARLVYGKKLNLKTTNHGFPILPTPTYEIISGTLLKAISNIKGRDFDEDVPEKEQNINLRTDLDNLSQYVGSVLETNVIAANEDFLKLEPVFPDIFEKNIGVEYRFSFKNDALVQITYDSSTGTVTYQSPVNLSDVEVRDLSGYGDLFIDGTGNKYSVMSKGVTFGGYNFVTLAVIDSITIPSSIKGVTPESITTSVGASIIKRIIFTFKNTGKINFTYDSTTGRVQYASSVDLSTVRVGDLFQDSGSNKYLITAVNDSSNYLDIVNIQTGLIPSSINTSVVASYISGSCWINNNPRDLLLSEMKLSFGPEFVPIKRLVRIQDEFSYPDGQVAYGIVRFDNRFDPRIVFYGSWENYENNLREAYVRNTDGYGRFLVTGYFTDVFVVMRRRAAGPSLSIAINGVSSGTITPSTIGSRTISGDVASLAGPKYHVVKLNSSTLENSTYLPVTVTATLPSSASTDSFDIYGFIFARTGTTGLLESGRAFESAHVVKHDMPFNDIPITAVSYQGRGGRLSYSVLENDYLRLNTVLDDMDSNGTPNGTWDSQTITITNSNGKVPYYNINDLVLVCGPTTIAPTFAIMSRITNISYLTNIITVDQYSPVPTPGTACYLIHVCSTDTAIPLTTEDQIAHYILPDDFINHTPTDLEYIHQSDRFVIGKDGLTVLAGEAVLITDTNVIGTKKVAQIQQGSSGVLRFTVLATRMDILCVNNATATVYVTIDGSPSLQYPLSITAKSQRKTIFSNARYQTHEVTFRVTSIGGTFSIAEIMLFGPKKPETIHNVVADLSQIAYFQASRSYCTLAPNLFPMGTIFKEASSNISYYNPSLGTGSNWSVTLDFTKNTAYGQYISSDKTDALVEFYILNTAFELQYILGPDHGNFQVFVDGIEISSVSGATVIGSYVGGTGTDSYSYSASYGRKNIGASGLTFGLKKITATCPRTKNISSSGYKIAFTGFYEGNGNGILTCGINKYGMYTSVVDTRLFNAIDMTPLETDTQVVEPANRAAKVNLDIGTTSVIVNLSEPYLDSDYVITPCLVNTVDTYPLLQPIMVKAQSDSSFTIGWNVPIPNGNYSMHYYTRTLDV